MAEIYGHRWTSGYGDNPNAGAVETWGKGLAGITPKQIANGLEACIVAADPWPPSLPLFRMMCLGIPAFEAVRLDSDQHDGFTRLVWQYLDVHRMRHVSSDKADKLLQSAYNRAREFVMRGGELPAPPVANIAHEERKTVPASTEQVARHMDDIADLLGVADPDPDEQADQQAEPAADAEAVRHAA